MNSIFYTTAEDDVILLFHQIESSVNAAKHKAKLKRRWKMGVKLSYEFIQVYYTRKCLDSPKSGSKWAPRHKYGTTLCYFSSVSAGPTISTPVFSAFGWYRQMNLM